MLYISNVVVWRRWRVMGVPLAGKKEKKLFLIYKEIQKGSGAKSYIRRAS
jgi:hypothetical protein